MGRAGLVMVLGGTALLLRTADAVPGWLTSVPSGVRLCANLEEAEARTGLRLDSVRDLLAEYQPLADGIRVTTRPVPAIGVAMRRRQDRQNQLSFFLSHRGGIPTALRAPLPSYHEIAIPLEKGHTASLKAEVRPDGSVWQDIEWASGSGAAALRFDGRTVELLRLARKILEATP